MKNTEDKVQSIYEWLEKGESSKTILREFTLRWNISERSIHRYIVQAKIKLDQQNKAKQNIIDEVRKNEIEKAAREKIMSDLEVEAVLCAIIRGEYEIEELRYIDGEPVTVKHKPTHHDIVLAADRLFKKRGSYPKEDLKPQNQTLVLQYNLQKPEDARYIEGV
ncbi:MAG TPA: hypothetical protein VK806_04250 [Bacteroidia bacterium]|jgi:hypothetical protein|nr:hypothetical protein [Bacteroidia bacterium]